MNHKLITLEMLRVKNCAKNNIYVALVLHLRRTRQKNWVETAASSKTEKSDGSEWLVVILLQMMCNKNKNSTGLIDSSPDFTRCAQIWLANKIGGATAIQKNWVEWTVGSCYPVGTIIVLVPLFNCYVVLFVYTIDPMWGGNNWSINWKSDLFIDVIWLYCLF